MIKFDKNALMTESLNNKTQVGNFAEASFPEYINHSIAQAGFEKPSAIQAQGWPIALSGRDMIGEENAFKLTVLDEMLMEIIT
jgi:ATP-dependent RNA helicase DDX5/DBP2